MPRAMEGETNERRGAKAAAGGVERSAQLADGSGGTPPMSGRHIRAPPRPPPEVSIKLNWTAAVQSGQATHAKVSTLAEPSRRPAAPEQAMDPPATETTSDLRPPGAQIVDVVHPVGLRNIVPPRTPPQPEDAVETIEKLAPHVVGLEPRHTQDAHTIQRLALELDAKTLELAATNAELNAKAAEASTLANAVRSKDLLIESLQADLEEAQLEIDTLTSSLEFCRAAEESRKSHPAVDCQLVESSLIHAVDIAARNTELAKATRASVHQSVQTESSEVADAHAEVLRLSQILTKLQLQVGQEMDVDEDERCSPHHGNENVMSRNKCSSEVGISGRQSRSKHFPYQTQIQMNDPDMVAPPCEDLSGWLEGDVPYSSPALTPQRTADRRKLSQKSTGDGMNGRDIESRDDDTNTSQEISGRFEMLTTNSGASSQASSLRKPSRRRRSLSCAMINGVSPRPSRTRRAQQDCSPRPSQTRRAKQVKASEFSNSASPFHVQLLHKALLALKDENEESDVSQSFPESEFSSDTEVAAGVNWNWEVRSGSGKWYNDISRQSSSRSLVALEEKAQRLVQASPSRSDTGEQPQSWEQNEERHRRIVVRRLSSSETSAVTSPRAYSVKSAPSRARSERRANSPHRSRSRTSPPRSPRHPMSSNNMRRSFSDNAPDFNSKTKRCSITKRVKQVRDRMSQLLVQTNLTASSEHLRHLEQKEREKQRSSLSGYSTDTPTQSPPAAALRDCNADVHSGYHSDSYKDDIHFLKHELAARTKKEMLALEQGLLDSTYEIEQALQLEIDTSAKLKIEVENLQAALQEERRRHEESTEIDRALSREHTGLLAEQMQLSDCIGKSETFLELLESVFGTLHEAMIKGVQQSSSQDTHHQLILQRQREETMTDVINADMQRTPSLDMFERIEATLSAQTEEHAAEMIRERNAHAREVSALANAHEHALQSLRDEKHHALCLMRASVQNECRQEAAAQALSQHTAVTKVRDELWQTVVKLQKMTDVCMLVFGTMSSLSNQIQDLRVMVEHMTINGYDMAKEFIKFQRRDEALRHCLQSIEMDLCGGERLSTALFESLRVACDSLDMDSEAKAEADSINACLNCANDFLVRLNQLREECRGPRGAYKKEPAKTSLFGFGSWGRETVAKPEECNVSTQTEHSESCNMGLPLPLADGTDAVLASNTHEKDTGSLTKLQSYSGDSRKGSIQPNRSITCPTIRTRGSSFETSLMVGLQTLETERCYEKYAAGLNLSQSGETFSLQDLAVQELEEELEDMIHLAASSLRLHDECSAEILRLSELLKVCDQACRHTSRLSQSIDRSSPHGTVHSRQQGEDGESPLSRHAPNGPGSSSGSKGAKVMHVGGASCDKHREELLRGASFPIRMQVVLTSLELHPPRTELRNVRIAFATGRTSKGKTQEMPKQKLYKSSFGILDCQDEGAVVRWGDEPELELTLDQERQRFTVTCFAHDARESKSKALPLMLGCGSLSAKTLLGETPLILAIEDSGTEVGTLHMRATCCSSTPGT